jgi:hypothetical protein
MKRLAVVGAAGVDRALSGPVVHTGAGAAPVGKVADKEGRQRAAFSLSTRNAQPEMAVPPGGRHGPH